MIDGIFFIPENDITGQAADGRTLILAHKGVPMLLVVARRLGYVKDEVTVGPTETKVEVAPPMPRARRQRKTQ